MHFASSLSQKENQCQKFHKIKIPRQTLEKKEASEINEIKISKQNFEKNISYKGNLMRQKFHEIKIPRQNHKRS